MQASETLVSPLTRDVVEAIQRLIYTVGRGGKPIWPFQIDVQVRDRQ